MQVLNMLALKPTKTDQCYSNISVTFVTLLLLQLLQFKTKLKHESVDFPGSDTSNGYTVLLQERSVNDVCITNGVICMYIMVNSKLSYLQN